MLQDGLTNRISQKSLSQSIKTDSRDSLGMDDSGSLGRLCPLPDGPCSNLVGSTGEEPDQVQTSIPGRGDLAQRAGGSDLLLLLPSFLLAHVLEPLFERDREGDQEITRVVLVDPSLDLGQPLVLLSDVVSLGQVDEVDDGLGREELETVDDLDLACDEQIERISTCSSKVFLFTAITEWRRWGGIRYSCAATRQIRVCTVISFS